MMNRYETVFIMTPVLSETQMSETVRKFKKLLLDNGSEIIHEENWGLRKLAYPIQKKSTGFYYLVHFTGDGNIVNKLEINYRRDERIIRFLTMRMDKYAIEYEEKRKNNKKEKKEEK